MTASSTFIRGYGARYRVAPGTEVGAAPSDDGSLISARRTPAGLSNGFLEVDGEGHRPELIAGADGTTGGLERAGDAGARAGWEVEARGVCCAWPAGFKLFAVAHSAWCFELTPAVSSTEAVIFLRGPLHGAQQTPTPPDLIAPGQTLVADDMSADAMWMELEYAHEDTIWRQRHQYAVPRPETVVLVTAQAPRGQHESLFAAADVVAKSVRLLVMSE